MNTDTSLEKWQHHGDLRKLLVLCAEGLNRIVVDLGYRFPFIFSVEIAILERHGELLTLTLAE